MAINVAGPHSQGDSATIDFEGIFTSTCEAGCPQRVVRLCRARLFDIRPVLAVERSRLRETSRPRFSMGGETIACWQGSTGCDSRAFFTFLLVSPFHAQTFILAGNIGAMKGPCARTTCLAARPVD